MIVQTPQHLEGHQTLGAPNTSYAEGPLSHGDGAVGAERPEDRCVPRGTLPHPGEEELNVFCEGLHVGFELRGIQKTGVSRTSASGVWDGFHTPYTPYRPRPPAFV